MYHDQKKCGCMSACRNIARNALLPLALAWVTASGTAGPLRLVSVRDPAQPAPAGGNGDSFSPIISPDGRFVLFASAANNLVVNSNGNPITVTVSPRLNVFLRDRANGTTTLASVNLAGTGGGNGDSLPTAISADGRYALFESLASDLVAGDTNGLKDVFLHDFVAGTNILISASTNGNPGNGVCRGSVMTSDGRYVAFVSAANNLVPGDTNGIPDVFVRDVLAGVTTMVSIGAGQCSPFNLLTSSESPAITPDGHFVAFYSTATNLVPGTPAAGCVYVRNLVGSATIWASTNAGTIAQPILHTTNVASFNPAISADGNFVAFETSTNGFSYASGLILRQNLATGLTGIVNSNAFVPPTSNFEDFHSLDMTPDGRFVTSVGFYTNASPAWWSIAVFLWDSQTGTNTLVSGGFGNNGTAFSICDWPSVDPSGRFVAFLSSATNLVTNSFVADYHLYVQDTVAGTTTLVDADTNGIGSRISIATAPRMSADGRFIAFESPDTTLVLNDRNHDSDVFLRDLSTNLTELISVRHPALGSASPNGPGAVSGLSASTDGRFVSFCSDADNLVPNDTNGVRDVFVRDLFNGGMKLISVNSNGIPADNLSSEPAISGDGRFVAFTSSADDLVPGDTNNATDIFIRDVRSNLTSLVSVSTNGTRPGNGPSYSPALSADARYVLFRSKASNLAPGPYTYGENLFLRDLQSGTTIPLTTNGVLSAGMTPDGHFIAFSGASANLYVWDSQKKSAVYTNISPPVPALIISPDGNRIAYTNTSGLYGLDRALKTNWQILPATSGPRLGSHFSGDSVLLPYTARIASTNVVYLYDFQARTSRQVSSNFLSGMPNGNSDNPDISADGRFVAFRSSATNLLAAADLNDVPDLFLYDVSAGTTTILTTNRYNGAPGDNRSGAPLFSPDGRTLFFPGWASDLVPQDFNHQGDIFSLALLYANLSPASATQGPTLTWPARPGETYRVQFKTTLSESTWMDVTGTVTIVGNQAQLTDLAPSPGQRFYRVVVSNQ
jgi:Tol biopolymer transport system component